MSPTRVLVLSPRPARIRTVFDVPFPHPRRRLALPAQGCGSPSTRARRRPIRRLMNLDLHPELRLCQWQIGAERAPLLG